jgi:hypothetical protein
MPHEHKVIETRPKPAAFTPTRVHANAAFTPTLPAIPFWAGQTD